jgi:hypothetical protein
MKFSTGNLAMAVCVIALAGGVIHQRSDYLKAKKQRDTARQTSKELQHKYDLAVAEHDDREKLVTEWLEFRGTAAFRGDFTTDDYPAMLARVVHASPIPDPETSPYTECLIELEIEPYKFGEDVYGEKIIGVVSGFRDRIPTEESRLSKGDIIHCILVPENHISAEVKKVQRVSTVEDLTLDTRYLAGISRMGRGQPVRTPINTYEKIPTRAESIAKDLKRMEDLLAKHGGDWETWHKDTQQYRDLMAERVITEGEDITLEERITFRHMGHLSHEPGSLWPHHQLAMLTSMRDQLAERGVDLIVVPIPTKEVINWPHFLDAPVPDGILMPYRLFFLHSILKADIEVIDLAPTLTKAWGNHEHVYYDGDDGHPADGGIQATADAVAERLARYNFEPQVQETWRIPFSYRIPTGFDLFPESSKTSDRYIATRVMTMDLKGVRDDSVARSPILLVSDSFGSVPYEYGVRNANFVSHLSARTGVPMYHKQVGGGGPRMLRHMAADSHDLLANRKVCIFLFSELYMFQHARGNAKHNWTVEQLPDKSANK